MNTNTMETTDVVATPGELALPAGTASRVLQEGYGPGAWHGADLKAALADVTAEVGFWRPGPARHNIAEIALHHAYCARNVRARLAGGTPEPFVLSGDDWFPVDDQRTLSWKRVTATVEREHQLLADVVASIEAGTLSSPVPEDERFGLVLGVTSHAIYHAG